MRAPTILCVCLAVAAAGCGSSSRERTFALKGQILSIASDRQQAVVKHDEIKDFMPAMTMPYKVRERWPDSIAPGDLIEATLVVVSNDAYLIDVKRVGAAPLEKAPVPSASSGFELLRPGEVVPDGSFLDQDGQKRTFSSFKGSILAITFIYTQCPLPDFCPLMDRHFVSVQQAAKTDPSLRKVHLLSVSIDPLADTPPVLKKHAGELKADPSRWTFLTGDRDDIDQFGSRFGLSVSRALDDPLNITHNLRTVIVDAEGKLVKMYTGNEWTPAQVVADLKTVAQAGR
ncbi:MAG: SCO family protein [Vicinamibacterales bacterium]